MNTLDAEATPRYFLDTDNSCHWYMIPVENRAEWLSWCALDEEDEASWTAPEFAKRLGGHPNMITFADPQ